VELPQRVWVQEWVLTPEMRTNRMERPTEAQIQDAFLPRALAISRNGQGHLQLSFWNGKMNCMKVVKKGF
jgi:hypothetical protein